MGSSSLEGTSVVEIINCALSDQQHHALSEFCRSSRGSHDRTSNYK